MGNAWEHASNLRCIARNFHLFSPLSSFIGIVVGTVQSCSDFEVALEGWLHHAYLKGEIMSYEVLAQKWRPRLFEEVVGQTHIIQTLKNQILSDRVGHAYLFWGPRGTGKTTVARILAKAVNCPNRHQETDSQLEVTAEPCNQCHLCAEITQGRSFDVIEMDAASNRGIDPIRELRENVKLAPASNLYKIYIIDEAHMLTQEAFNALLKTLEEPPPHVIFILATTEHHKIPKTIISRCQDFDFRYMEIGLIADRLRSICTAEDIHIDDEGLASIAEQSEGCLRDAENLLERLIASVGKTLDAEEINQILGFGSSHLINELVRTILECKLSESIQTLASLAKQGVDLPQCSHQLITYFRQLRILAINSNLENLIQGSRSELKRMQEQANQTTTERLSRIIKILTKTHSEIKRHGYAQVHLESALIDMCSIQVGIQLGEIAGRLSEIEDKIDRHSALQNQAFSSPPEIDAQSAANPTNSHTPVFERSASPSPLGTDTDLVHQTTHQNEKIQSGTNLKSNLSHDYTLLRDSKQLEKVWEQVLQTLRAENMALYTYLKSTAPLPNQDNNGPAPDVVPKLKIACNSALASESIISEDEKTLVAQILGNLIGHPVQIEFVASNTPPSMNPMTTPKTTHKTASMMFQSEVERDAQIAPTLNLFEAKILKIEPK